MGLQAHPCRRRGTGRVGDGGVLRWGEALLRPISLGCGCAGRPLVVLDEA